jgi:hypothetical protein
MGSYKYLHTLNILFTRHSSFNLRYNVRVINEDHKLALKNRTKTYVSDDELDTNILIGQTYAKLRLLHTFRK